jgi:hypothetical protein
LQYEKWKDYDVFAHQKISTFKSSKPAIVELATRYRTVVSDLSAKDMAPEMALFTEMCEICLRGNATDLSLLTFRTYDLHMRNFRSYKEPKLERLRRRMF